MPLPPETRAARRYLQSVKDTHPDDERLVSLIDMMRDQLDKLAKSPTPEMRKAMAARTDELEAHMKAKGYGQPSN